MEVRGIIRFFQNDIRFLVKVFLCIEVFVKMVIEDGGLIRYN